MLHGDEIGFGVEYRGRASHDLILLGHDDATFGFQPADRRTAAGADRGRFDLDGTDVGYYESVRFHGGVALHHFYIAREGRLLLLIVHHQRRRFDLDRLVAVLREPLHGVGHALSRALSADPAGRRRDRQQDQTATQAADGAPINQATVNMRHPENHFAAAVFGQSFDAISILIPDWRSAPPGPGSAGRLLAVLRIGTDPARVRCPIPPATRRWSCPPPGDRRAGRSCPGSGPRHRAW